MVFIIYVNSETHFLVYKNNQILNGVCVSIERGYVISSHPTHQTPLDILQLCFVLCLFFQHVKLAKLFESLVKRDGRFMVVNRVVLGLVCFSLKVQLTICDVLSTHNSGRCRASYTVHQIKRIK